MLLSFKPSFRKQAYPNMSFWHENLFKFLQCGTKTEKKCYKKGEPVWQKSLCIPRLQEASKLVSSFKRNWPTRNKRAETRWERTFLFISLFFIKAAVKQTNVTQYCWIQLCFMMMDEVAKRVNHCRVYPRTKEKLNQHHLTSFNWVAKHV